MGATFVAMGKTRNHAFLLIYLTRHTPLSFYVSHYPHCLGAEIPDVVSALALARAGYYDGAVAGAIGSQVRI
jgi:hypothetical protein